MKDNNTNVASSVSFLAEITTKLNQMEVMFKTLTSDLSLGNKPSLKLDRQTQNSLSEFRGNNSYKNSTVLTQMNHILINYFKLNLVVVKHTKQSY